jgi:hypothetical protein
MDAPDARHGDQHPHEHDDVAAVLLDRQIALQNLVEQVTGHVEHAAAEDEDRSGATEPRKSSQLCTQRLPDTSRLCIEHAVSIANYS